MKEIAGKRLYIQLGLGTILFIYAALFRVDNVELLINLMAKGISVVFAIGSFFLVYHNFNTQINIRAKSMGICGIIISVFIIIQCRYELLKTMQYEIILIHKVLYNILGAVFLFICTMEEEYEITANIKSVLNVTIIVIVIYILTSIVETNQICEVYIIGIQLCVFILLSTISVVRCIEIKKTINLTRLKDDVEICNNLCFGSILIWSGMGLELFIESYILVILRLLVEIIMSISVFSYIKNKVFNTNKNMVYTDLVHNEGYHNQGYLVQDVLISSVSQINSSIKQMNGIVQEITRGLKSYGNDSQLLYMNKVEKNCKILQKLSGDMVKLNHDQNEIIYFERSEIISFVKESIDSLTPYFKSKSIELEYKITSNPIYCDFGIQELERILINIVSNSIKYTKQGGKVVVEISRCDGENVQIQVVDTGVGIRDDDLKHIFSRFSRYSINGEKEQEGSGLGLAIVKHLVELHSGSIEVMSSLGSGTKVCVKLPINQ